jgi:polyisoprenoid-binding protein YceI
MNRFVRSLALAALLVPAALAAAAAQQGPGGPPPPALPPNGWRIDLNHSAVTFRVRHLGISWVNGQFKTWTGDLVFDPAHPEGASITARIQTNSVDTGNERRDNDIRSGNYLAVDSFPEMAFVGRLVHKADDTHFHVAGDLTLRGQTHPVTLDVEMIGTMTGQRGKRIAFTATTTINRMDYGVAFNRLMEGAQVVGNEIRITIDIEASQPNAS